MSNKKLAFTLAEILITLAIIGVLASLTIPSLVSNINDQQNKIAWRKAFSDISQATMRVVADNGGNLSGVFTTHDVLRDKYIEYLNYTKKCNNGQSWENCWHGDQKTKYLNGTSVPAGWFNSSGVILSNGSLIQFGVRSLNCSEGVGSPPIYSRCATIQFDINGFKGPNTIGKDIYTTNLTAFDLKAEGITGDSDSPSVTCITGSTAVSNSGWGCSALYLYQ